MCAVVQTVFTSEMVFKHSVSAGLQRDRCGCEKENLFQVNHKNLYFCCDGSLYCQELFVFCASFYAAHPILPRSVYTKLALFTPCVI